MVITVLVKGGIVGFYAQKSPSEEVTFKLRPEGSVSHVGGGTLAVRGKTGREQTERNSTCLCPLVESS